MNGGYVMLDFSGKTTGTDAVFASEITKAIATKKMIVAHNLNGQSPVVMTANANGVLTGGGVTVSVSGTTVTINSPGVGSVSDARIISGEVTGTIGANSITKSTIPLTIPTGYSIIGVSSLVVTGANSAVSLTIRGWRMSATNDGIEVYFGNPSENSVSNVKVNISVMIGRVVAQQSRDSDDEGVVSNPIEKKTAKKGSAK